jgi:hypothetical protein
MRPRVLRLASLLLLASLPLAPAIAYDRNPVLTCTLEKTDAAGTMRFWQRMDARGGTLFSWNSTYVRLGPSLSVHWYSEGAIVRPPGPEAQVHFTFFGVELRRRQAHVELLGRSGEAIAGPRTRRGDRLYVAIPLYRLRPFTEGVGALVVQVVDDASGQVLSEGRLDPALLDNPDRAFGAARTEWEAMIADPAAHCQPPEEVVVT